MESITNNHKTEAEPAAQT